MNIRDVNKVDAQRCGRILYDAFTNLAEKHNFPPDFPSPEVATGLASMLIGDPGFYGVVAEEAGTIVGSNFMDERSTIFGIGPISVAPEAQNHAVGRRLMSAVLDRAAEKKGRRGPPGDEKTSRILGFFDFSSFEIPPKTPLLKVAAAGR